ncbi:hypothetical protein NL676_002917 [Syzygium grande]|nr:hypothetical protein NL676_002917 [Syzygium grande]
MVGPEQRRSRNGDAAEERPKVSSGCRGRWRSTATSGLTGSAAEAAPIIKRREGGGAPTWAGGGRFSDGSRDRYWWVRDKRGRPPPPPPLFFTATSRPFTLGKPSELAVSNPTR